MSLPKPVPIVCEVRFDVHGSNRAFGAGGHINEARGGGGRVRRIGPTAICTKVMYGYCATARPVLRGLDLTTVRARPCEVVEDSMEPSKRCEVFEVLFKMHRDS